MFQDFAFILWISAECVISANSVLKLQIYFFFLFFMWNINFISKTVVAYRKIITRTGCNRLLFFLMYKLRRSVCNTVSMLSICITRTTLKTFKSILTYTKNVRKPWLNNENLKEKERKKTLIFVMFTLAWMFCQYNSCFVLFLVSSICNGVTEGVRWMRLHRPREKACPS